MNRCSKCTADLSLPSATKVESGVRYCFFCGNEVGGQVGRPEPMDWMTTVRVTSVVVLVCALLGTSAKFLSESGMAMHQNLNRKLAAGFDGGSENHRRLVACPRCNGMGYTNCVLCGGSGVKTRTIDGVSITRPCERKKFDPCWICDKTGQVTDHLAAAMIKDQARTDKEFQEWSRIEDKSQFECEDIRGGLYVRGTFFPTRTLGSCQAR